MVANRLLGFKNVSMFFILIILFAFIGCSNSNAPPEKQGKEKMNQLIEEYISEYANLKSFKKTDGKASEDKGVKGYSMAFQAELEVKNDCYYYGFAGFLDKNPSSEFENKDHIKAVLTSIFSNKSSMWGRGNGTAKKKGEIVILKGELDFQKTEKGWQSVGIKFINM
jgi:hypothetical protein